MTHIFISYSRKDQVCVNTTVSYLEAQDFPVWIDRKRIPFTTNWVNQIIGAIQDAKLLILFWSKDAEQSKYVQAELNAASQRIFTGELPILAVQLDSTPLPGNLTHIQAADFRIGCDVTAISALAQGIDSNLRTFNPKKPLKDQLYEVVADTPFVRVRYRVSAGGNCTAYIVGDKDGVMSSSPRELAVCLQFMRPVKENMLADVYKTLKKPDGWILHITGPVDPNRGYWIDNTKRALWDECYTFITQVVDDVTPSKDTVVQLFALAAGVLIGRLSMHYRRFKRIKFYNYAPETGTPYIEVYDVGLNDP